MFLIFCVLVIACTKTPEERFLEHQKLELAKGTRNDKLFMGLYLKMPLREFREYCFEMNLKGKFKQGGIKTLFGSKVN